MNSLSSTEIESILLRHGVKTESAERLLMCSPEQIKRIIADMRKARTRLNLQVVK